MGKRISFDFEQFCDICKYMDSSDCGEFFKAVKERVTGGAADEDTLENIVMIALSMAKYKVEEGEGK